jgi:F0F1-type ATP synthase epsilon subunit
MRTLILKDREMVCDKEAYMAVLPGLDGEFSVLDFHQGFLYRLQKGIIKIRESEESETLMFHIKDGLARFEGNSLLVLCEGADAGMNPAPLKRGAG